jgi:hypothetical protein
LQRTAVGFKKERLGQETEQATLAVRDDADGFIRIVIAEHGNEGGQAQRGQDHVEPAGVVEHWMGGVTLRGIQQAKRFRLAAVPHFRQGVRGVGEWTATFGEILVEAVAITVQRLAVRRLEAVYREVFVLPKTPIKRYDRAVRFLRDAALVINRIGIVLQHIGITSLGVAVGCRTKVAAQALGQPCAQPVLDRLIRSAYIVDPMHQNDRARQIVTHGDDLIGQSP